MDFADESYVRLYVRDTKTWLRLGFAGQCCLMFLLRKLDRAGVLDGIEDLCADVSLITGVPDSIVEIGMPRLLERGVFELHGTSLVMPNFLDAQTAARTDRARQKDARDKRLAESRLLTIRDPRVTPRDGAVTECDQTSQPVTLQPDPSQSVTLYSSVPSFTKPSCTELSSGTRAGSWWKYPDGWRWTDETLVRARELGLAEENLREHVDYWTTHEFTRPVTNLEKELVRCLPAIRKRAETEQHKPRAGPKRSGSLQKAHGVDPYANMKED
jgi:hypothetical protein